MQQCVVQWLTDKLTNKGGREVSRGKLHDMDSFKMGCNCNSVTTNMYVVHAQSLFYDTSSSKQHQLLDV